MPADPANPARVDALLEGLRQVLLAAHSWSFTAEPGFGPDDPPTLYVDIRIEPFRPR